MALFPKEVFPDASGCPLGCFPAVGRTGAAVRGLEVAEGGVNVKVNLARRAVRRRSKIGASDSESLASRGGEVAVF
jgi:hypothetical protein